MKRAEPSQSTSHIGPLATVVLVIAVLYVAQDLFLPFALAALVTFLLAPVVAGLQHWRFPRLVAVVTTVFQSESLHFWIGPPDLYLSYFELFSPDGWKVLAVRFATVKVRSFTSSMPLTPVM